MEKIKNSLWAKIPDNAKPFFRYIYFGSQIPFNYPENLNKFRYYTQVGRKEKINFTPPVFIATICSVCNLRCPTCQYLIKDTDVFKGRGYIKAHDFEAVLNKYSQGVDTVFLTGGEPLLHPELDKLVEMVKSKGMSLKISTNGILIEKRIEILKSFDFVNISMDSYNEESFKRLRGGTQNQFDSILRGLALLKANKINFMISFLLSEENLDEIQAMLEFAYKTQPSEIIFHNINPHGSKDYNSLTLNSKKVAQAMADIMGKNDYPFDIYLPIIFDTESKHFKTSKCIQPWNYCCFDDNGDIAICCQLIHDKALGNIFNNYEFNSEMMKNYRQQIIKGNYVAKDCLYCHRRFMGEYYGHFDAKNRKWTRLSEKGAVHNDKVDNL